MNEIIMRSVILLIRTTARQVFFDVIAMQMGPTLLAKLQAELFGPLTKAVQRGEEGAILFGEAAALQGEVQRLTEVARADCDTALLALLSPLLKRTTPMTDELFSLAEATRVAFSAATKYLASEARREILGNQPNFTFLPENIITASVTPPLIVMMSTSRRDPHS